MEIVDQLNGYQSLFELYGEVGTIFLLGATFTLAVVMKEELRPLKSKHTYRYNYWTIDDLFVHLYS